MRSGASGNTCLTARMPSARRSVRANRASASSTFLGSTRNLHPLSTTRAGQAGHQSRLSAERAPWAMPSGPSPARLRQRDADLPPAPVSLLRVLVRDRLPCERERDDPVVMAAGRVRVAAPPAL